MIEPGLERFTRELAMARETGQLGFRRTGTFREDELKICDLCGSLNLASNSDCFICGWTGHFEQNRDIVHTAVEIVVQRHGRLELQYLTDIRTYREASPGIQTRFCGWLASMWRWLSG
jgi:hypothetical protein